MGLVSGCQSTQYLSNQNLEFLYNPSGNHRAAHLKIFHQAPEKPRLYVKVPLNNLSYTGGGAEATAKAKVTYRIYKNYEYRTLFDSGQKALQFTKAEARKKGFHQALTFDIPQADQYYLVAVSVKDKVADQRARTFVYYRPYQKGYDQRFLVHRQPENKLHTRSFISIGKPFTIKTSAVADSLLIKRYNPEAFGPAAPPFREDYTNNELTRSKPDSVFKVSRDQTLTFKQRGLYSIQGDSRAATLTLRVVRPHFPELKKPVQLRNSLRYITSRSNYQDLSAKSPKPAVDQFWLNRANRDKAQAKAMIQRYYQRVQQANSYFTSYKKGWKTDRGIIYIVFGKPYIVYRTNQQEVWIYANRTTMPNLEFRFERKQHPLAPEYYRLKRSKYYEEPFYQGVERLREGSGKP